MARGDVGFVADTISGGVEILNRKEFEAVPMTLDFGNSTDTIKAGTPINADGEAVSATPWTGAVGILLHDVDPDYPTGAILKKAYIHVGRAQENSGLTYDDKIVTETAKAGCRIVLEEVPSE